MAIDITECVHCGNKQKTVKPWKSIPTCRLCKKPMHLTANKDAGAKLACSDGLVVWPNNCLNEAIGALRYLAGNKRPEGGQNIFNSEHLLQIANELEAVGEKNN